MRIFVAGPLGIGTPDQAQNCLNAMKAGGLLAIMGHFPFIPHAYGPMMSFACPELPESWWRAWCLDMVETCHALYRLPGESTGAPLEEARAVELGLPVWRRFEDVTHQDGVADGQCMPWLEERRKEIDEAFGPPIPAEELQESLSARRLWPGKCSLCGFEGQSLIPDSGNDVCADALHCLRNRHVGRFLAGERCCEAMARGEREEWWECGGCGKRVCAHSFDQLEEQPDPYPECCGGGMMPADVALDCTESEPSHVAILSGENTCADTRCGHSEGRHYEQARHCMVPRCDCTAFCLPVAS